MGAVVVSPTGEVIGRGRNSPVTSMDPTAHAEMTALRQAAARLGNYRLIGCTIYVTLEPCLMCAGAMVHSRVRRLVYGAADIAYGAVDSLYRLLYDKRLNHQVEVVAGILEEECSRLLKDFFAMKRC